MSGALLLGGPSSRFGSPKALAELDGEPLAIRAHRLLSETFDDVIAVGKASAGLELPFPVIDDGDERQAAIVGVAAALRHAKAEICVVIPTDMPALTTLTLLRLASAAAAGADAAVGPLGPLPGAFRTSLLAVLDRRIHAGKLALHRALTDVSCVRIDCPEDELVNVNTRDELDRIRPQRAPAARDIELGAMPRKNLC